VNWVHRTIIVTNPYVGLARQLAAGIAGESGAGMWVRALSASGAAPATHWISAGLIQEHFADMLADPPAIHAACGGQVPLVTIEGMVNSATIRVDADPHAVIAELGLQFVGSGT